MGPPSLALPLPGTCTHRSPGLAVLPPLPHPCGVSAEFREQRRRSEGRDHPPTRLCLTWGNAGLLHRLILAAVRANLDSWLDLGIQVNF